MNNQLNIINIKFILIGKQGKSKSEKLDDGGEFNVMILANLFCRLH